MSVAAAGDPAGHVPELYDDPFRLTAEQVAKLRAYGRESEVVAGAVVFAAGSDGWEMAVVVEGGLEIVDRQGLHGERVVVRYGPNQFTGELGLLTGRRATLSTVAAMGSRLLLVPAGRLREIVAEDRVLGGLILDAYMTRRTMLLSAGLGLTLVGSRYDQETRQLLELLARNRIPTTWYDAETSPDALPMLERLGAGVDDMPVVAVSGAVLHRPSAAEVQRAVGVPDLESDEALEDCDLVVVGAGPGGLAAAVYGASEGLTTMLVEDTALGGQAGTSSRIENYLGFPAGVSGAELSARAVVQAEKFGVRIRLAEVVGLTFAGGRHRVQLDDGDTVRARSVIIATGARYRRLPLDRIEDFEGVGVYYEATTVEAQACGLRDVAVVGAGNSAGQAALFLAETCSNVRLVIRADGLADSMSRYLIDRIAREPRISVHPRTEVRKLLGVGELTGLELEGPDGPFGLDACALFLFIGAVPCTGWLRGEIALDEHGFVLTGGDLPAGGGEGVVPLSLETSRPGVFCVGDARSGSVKRVATAIGEGSMAVRLAFERLFAAGRS